MYFLMITNTQNETTRLMFNDLQECISLIEKIEKSDSICIFCIYSDEYEAIKQMHNDKYTELINGNF